MQHTEYVSSIHREQKPKIPARSPVRVKQEPPDAEHNMVPSPIHSAIDDMDLALIQQELNMGQRELKIEQQELNVEQIRFRLLQAKAKDASRKRQSSVEALPDHLQPLSRKQKSKPQIGDEIVELSD